MGVTHSLWCQTSFYGFTHSYSAWTNLVEDAGEKPVEGDRMVACLLTSGA